MTIKYSELNLGQIEEAVNKLGGMDGLKRFLADELVVAERQPKFAPKGESPLDTIIRVDRSVRPVYPEWAEKAMHPELEGTGPAEYDLVKVEQWFHDEQKKGVMVGNRIYEHLNPSRTRLSLAGNRSCWAAAATLTSRASSGSAAGWCWTGTGSTTTGATAAPRFASQVEL
jgi:hypothetical protein